MHRWHPLCTVLLATSALVALRLPSAVANPLGAQVVGGTATVQGSGTSTVTVTQSSQNAVINWNTFNIGAGEKTRFSQPNSSATVLNRVTGDPNPSQILGTLSANGRVFIVNPNGVLIGNGAVINTASFLATTHDIANADFMAGRYNFNIPGRPDASVVNQGTITASNGGFAALVAPGVRNSGVITANFGKVALASGNTFSLDLYGDQLIKLAVSDSIAASVKDVATGQTLTSLIKNDGKLRANGGQVALTAVSARRVVDSVINNSGVIEARSIGRRGGMIVLGGPAASTKIAGAPTQTIKVSGKLDVSAKKGNGGTVEIVGENIVIAGATLDASGATGGGKVLIGGDIGGGAGNSLVTNASLEAYTIPTATTVSIDAASVIGASAIASGNGGKVIVWSDQATSFLGAINARGGANAGNGGFVEVSGHQTLAFKGIVNTLAPNGSAGTLLLDPGNLNIVAGGGTTATPGAGSYSGSTNTDSTVLASDLVTALQGGNVIVQTATTGPGSGAPGSVGDIIVETSFTWGVAPTTLTLSAFHDITLNSGVTISSSAGGNVILRADSTGIGSGTVSFIPTSGISTAGAVSIYYNPSNYSSPTNYSGNVSGGASLTAYMLINSLVNLQTMQSTGTTLAGTYALGKSIDATGFVPAGPGTTLTGLLDGNGGLGTNYTISNLTLVSSQSPIGLFGFIGSGATVRNLNMANVNLTLTGQGPAFLGPLAGENDGRITSVQVLSGTINGGSFSGVGAGGLVGQNRGTISNSSAAVNVTLGDASSLNSINFAGGLVGSNLGTIISSSASGNVSVGLNGDVGGLVGQNGGDFFNGGAGTITNSFATGAVSGNGFSAGGLVGFNDTVGTITNSYATGSVTSGAPTSGNCNGGNCSSPSVGGLVGANEGAITGAGSSLTYQTYATGNVSVSSRGLAGGLVGSNSGLVVSTYATGTVSGAAGVAGGNDIFGNQTILGGLVGTNQGIVTLSYAMGNVGSRVDRLMAGGLVGDNEGTISNSYATGNVIAGNFSQAGGFASNTDSFNCNCGGGSGIAFNTDGTITNSYSTGNVSVGASSAAGGFAGGAGNLSNDQASGSVTGGANSILGGLVGLSNAVIQRSSSSGAVRSTGTNVWLGGLVGLNAGVITNSSTTSSVTGTSDSIVGGFAAVNLGLIDPSYASGPISVSGDNNVVGGFAGVNFGTIDQASATGAVSGVGGTNIYGTVVGANATFINIPGGFLPFSTFPSGTLTNSNSSNSGGQVGVTNPSTLPAYPFIITSCNDGVCQVFRDGILGGGSTIDAPPSVLVPPLVYLPTVPPDNVTPLPIFIALTTSTGGGATPSTGGPARYLNATPGVAGFTPAPFPLRPNGLVSGMPPLGETRFVQNELLLRLTTATMSDALRQFLQGLNMRVISIDPLGALGGAMARIELPPGMFVRRAVALIEANPTTPEVSTNSLFKFAQANAGTSKGDPAQYTIGKFELEKIHKVATGKGVTVAVIDSQVDERHTELQGSISSEFDTLTTKEPPHSHGTAMAGAIGSHDRLLGVAPDARIIAVRAFGESNNTAEGTSASIIKGLEWAMNQGAKVVNMSFAGPRDPALEHAIKAAYDKGLIMVAAAGNAGPKSPPLYPGADPHVIAVTATDVRDRGFRGANQGPQLSVAAPGVDVLAPAPDAGYQMSTGTSIATAHVTGVVALMLERDPRLTPTEVRRILEETATDLGAKGKDGQYGWGLVSPGRALETVASQLKSSDALPKPR